MAENSLSFNQTAKGITEFIEVAVHSILYSRQLYPPDLFVRRRKYDTPVFQSRHPALNEYISGAVKAVGEELILGNVDKVVVVIKDRNQIALERFIFSVQNMIEVELYDKDSCVESAMNPTTLSQYFRSFLIKLNMAESQLGLLDPDDDPTFAIVLELKGNKAPITRDKEPPPWVPADIEHTTCGVSDDAQLHLFRAVDTGIINLSLFVQESGEKLRRQKEPYSSDRGKQKAEEEGG